MSRRPRFTVTDHAVLRELERMHGIDIKAVRRAIARKVARGVDKGACGVLSGGLRYILCDGCVITVLDGPRSHAAEARRREGGDGG